MQVGKPGSGGASVPGIIIIIIIIITTTTFTLPAQAGQWAA
jgi:hypothetical protein